MKNVRYKTVKGGSCKDCAPLIFAEETEIPQFLENDRVKLHLDNQGLLVQSMYDKESGSNITLNEKFYEYDGVSTKSCIYTFKPLQEAKISIPRK